MEIEVNDTLEPIGFSLEVAAKVIGISRAKAYMCVNDGLLKAKKIGSRTITTRENCQEFIDSMPDFEPKIIYKLENSDK